jgi:hypothetical protein
MHSFAQGKGSSSSKRHRPALLTSSARAQRTLSRSFRALRGALGLGERMSASKSRASRLGARSAEAPEAERFACGHDGAEGSGGEDEEGRSCDRPRARGCEIARAAAAAAGAGNPSTAGFAGSSADTTAAAAARPPAAMAEAAQAAAFERAREPRLHRSRVCPLRPALGSSASFGSYAPRSSNASLRSSSASLRPSQHRSQHDHQPHLHQQPPPSARGAASRASGQLGPNARAEALSLGSGLATTPLQRHELAARSAAARAARAHGRGLALKCLLAVLVLSSVLTAYDIAWRDLTVCDWLRGADTGPLDSGHSSSDTAAANAASSAAASMGERLAASADGGVLFSKSRAPLGVHAPICRRSARSGGPRSGGAAAAASGEASTGEQYDLWSFLLGLAASPLPPSGLAEGVEASGSSSGVIVHRGHGGAHLPAATASERAAWLAGAVIGAVMLSGAVCGCACLLAMIVFAHGLAAERFVRTLEVSSQHGCRAGTCSRVGGSNCGLAAARACWQLVLWHGLAPAGCSLECCGCGCLFAGVGWYWYAMAL